MHTKFRKFVESVQDYDGKAVRVDWDGICTVEVTRQPDGKYLLHRGTGTTDQLEVTADELTDMIVDDADKVREETEHERYTKMPKEEMQRLINELGLKVVNKRNSASAMGYMMADRVLDEIEVLDRKIQLLRHYLRDK
jgi:hypothetical protein